MFKNLIIFLVCLLAPILLISPKLFEKVVLLSAPKVIAQNVKVQNLAEVIKTKGIVETEDKIIIYSKFNGVVKDVLKKDGDKVNKQTILAQIELDMSKDDISKLNEQQKSEFDISGDDNLNVQDKIEAEKEELEKLKQDLITKKKDYEALLLRNDVQGRIGRRPLVRKIANRITGGLVNEYSVSEEQIKEAEYNLQKANDDLNNKIAKLEEDKKMYEQKKDESIEKFLSEPQAIRAEKQGVILKSNIDKGQNIQFGTPLFVVGNQNNSYIKISVLSDDLDKIKVNQKVIITSNKMNGKTINGTIDYIDNKAKTVVSSLGVKQKRNNVRIKYDNDSMKFEVMDNVDVKIITNMKNNVHVCPVKAVFKMNGKNYVFIVKNNKSKLVEVKTGIESDEYVEIIEGLKEGDVVISDPDNSFKPNERVKIDYE